ncbi:TetM/TetW/TetO/TetS family tetracycline resistance ribosomal protection protein [Streptomyces sp. DSM 44915]|uniref:TetM/TetW/TetO/TetS family tetracycline resistance ribosomal protection protein n=1 Tax=Streptomyces chisholmiae TaxID=3075540 RepID=A0ABU2JQM5_9ACTN|nr:TetM/TetW/TetO/TetS family tetracycline resistance ribosomal protection protein [Streptomyces sp. DSM 44915]MDT0266513.1 TetM/TetW/TetO/TetS family tetracycline resistance ribosomal protection protein [Streptomyces sp. DSM 44915]
MTTVNIGVLAHVDAGKTSLTERLLFDHGAVARLGSVDDGSTRTDAGELERERGITIRTAVASFAVGDRQVNLVDTPGHPDFIAEVERALSVLDAAVLVLSAVEGVQAQTLVLARSLRRLGLPTLFFVNKIDRAGARPDALLADMRARLTPHLVPLTTVTDPGGRAARVRARRLADPVVRAAVAETLAEHDEALLARLVEGGGPPAEPELRALLAAQTAAGLTHPVLAGSALTGEGVPELTAALAALPAPSAAGGGPAGTVFAIERAPGGEKTAYLRLFDGELRARRGVLLRRRESTGGAAEYRGRISRIEVVAPGAVVERPLRAGEIGRLHGLPGVRVGDRLGRPPRGAAAAHFAPPGLETVVRAAEPARRGVLHAALTALADEDPLIRFRTDPDGTLTVLLYGAVQREVLAERLRRDFGVAAVFAPPTPVCFERPAGVGEALVEFARRGPNDFWATVGLRVEPAAPGSGVRFRRRTEWGALPRAFHRAIEEAVFGTLRQGLAGWEVTDCLVTLVRTGYDAPMSEVADFRGLTPVVLLRALAAAGTRVFEPCLAVELAIPRDTLSEVTGRLATLGGRVRDSAERADGWLLDVELPTRRAPELVAALPGLTRGEGAQWSRPEGDRLVRGVPPVRARRDGNPLDYGEYLRYLALGAEAAGRG